MTVTDNLRIGNFVFLLKKGEQIADGLKLGERHGLVVVSDHFDPD